MLQWCYHNRPRLVVPLPRNVYVSVTSERRQCVPATTMASLGKTIWDMAYPLKPAKKPNRL